MILITKYIPFLLSILPICILSIFSNSPVLWEQSLNIFATLLSVLPVDSYMGPISVIYDITNLRLDSSVSSNIFNYSFVTSNNSEDGTFLFLPKYFPYSFILKLHYYFLWVHRSSQCSFILFLLYELYYYLIVWIIFRIAMVKWWYYDIHYPLVK